MTSSTATIAVQTAKFGAAVQQVVRTHLAQTHHEVFAEITPIGGELGQICAAKIINFRTLKNTRISVSCKETTCNDMKQLIPK